jgi:hypothetical protein
VKRTTAIIAGGKPLKNWNRKEKAVESAEPGIGD